MHPHTSELFELNKMWFLWGMSLLILFLWGAKMLLLKKFTIQRTPLDLPLMLFLVSQFFSTIFSMDRSVSFWGYYSRFNGGFLSIITFIFLYYAFATNVLDKDKRNTIKISLVALLSGTAVAFWGFPSHFGYDPTCLAFRGTLDVSCWTEAFQPKVRIFSTLGQPNWLAAFLAILLPLTLGFGMKYLTSYFHNKKDNGSNLTKSALFFGAALLFYIDLIWTDSQSGFLGLWAGLFVFAGLILFQLIQSAHPQRSFRINIAMLGAVLAVLLVTSLMLGTPIKRLQQFSLQQLGKNEQQQQTPAAQAAPQLPALEFGGTDSSKIRLIVWSGALDIAKANPLFGSGVETFAFAYYKYRPVEHNLTSEWDYLYNKAHNEYLNYLATTGIFGLGSYLLFIGWFAYLVLKSLKNTKTQWYIPAALIGGWVSILVSNFFGFSVIVVNLFFFLIPLWVLHLIYPKFELVTQEDYAESTPLANTAIASLGLFVLFLQIVLIRYWLADKHYGLGSNLNKVGEIAMAYPELTRAVQLRPREDLFKDEMSVNLATLALAYQQQNESTMAAELATQAKMLSDTVITNHPNNVVYWKTRTRVMYSFAQIDANYYPLAIDAIEKAHRLAPTDAKVMYNMALMYDQGGNRDKAIEILDQTIQFKPNYRDAYYAKALLHSEKADELVKTDATRAQAERQKAKEIAELIVNRLSPNDQQAKELLQKLQ